MKKICLILAVTSAAIMALSCQKNETPVEEPAQAPRLMKCVIAETPIDSKVDVNLSTGKTSWEAGDKILVHGEGSSNRKVVTLAAGDISADGKTATIDVSGVTPYDRSGASPWYSSQIFASYPADLVPAGNLYYNSVFSGSLNTFLVSGCDDGGSTLYFYNLCGLMTFTISGDYDSYILTGNNSETVGYSVLESRIAHVLPAHGTTDIRYVKSGDGFTCAPLTSITGPLVADGTTINSIFFPAGVSFSGGFTLLLKKSGAIVDYVRSTKALTINPGQLFPIGTIPAGKIHEYVAPTSHDASHPAIAGAEDLGGTSAGTANSYIVYANVAANSNKVFKFKAVRGNSTTAVGAINSVEILWETYNNTTSVTKNSVIAEADFDKQDGNDDYWITFKMPETLHAGNALIAAKDAGGDVLWSWHIWVPSTTITSSTYGGVSVSPMMSRNMGALVDAIGDAETDIAIESCGMYYQWGRKDPFPGANEFAKYPGSMVKVSGTLSTRGPVSSTEIYKYPTDFITTGADTDGNKDWSTDHSSSLWGSVKNENDPCPPGWKIPIFADDTGDLWDKKVSDKTTLPGWANSTDHHWFRFGVEYDAMNPTITGYVYFPYAGYRTQDNGGYSYCNIRAHIWQALGGGSEYARLIYAAPNAQYVETQRKGRGGNIRCVAE